MYCNERINRTYYQSMKQDTQAYRILNLAREKGTLRAVDVDKIGIPRIVLSRLNAEGKLERIDRGIYRLPNLASSENESLVLIATRVPQAVFCLLSALQIHELTTQLPRQVWIAMPRGSHVPKIKYPPLRMIQVSGDAYTEGVEIHEYDQVNIRVYGIAKTIADCFKHRNKIGIDVALEALKDARSHKNVSIDEIWKYAKICRVANVMRPYLEAIQ